MNEKKILAEEIEIKDQELYNIMNEIMTKFVEMMKENKDFNTNYEKIKSAYGNKYATIIKSKDIISQIRFADKNIAIENLANDAICFSTGLPNFISDCIILLRKSQKELKFDQKIFGQYYRTFERYWIDKVIDYYLISPILNFSSDLDNIEFDRDTKIVLLDQNEISILKKDLELFPIHEYYKHIMFSSGYALRIDISRKKEEGGEIIEDKQRSVLTSLRLLKSGNPSFILTFSRYKGFSELGGFGKSIGPFIPVNMVGPFIPSPVHLATISEKDKFHFSRQDIDTCKDIYTKLVKNTDIKIGIRKFNEIYTRRLPEDKILDMAILLESTLLKDIHSEVELNYRLRLRIVRFLRPKDAKKLFNLLKFFYSIRSAIVHDGFELLNLEGQPTKEYQDKIKKNKIVYSNPLDFVSEIEDVCRHILRKLIMNGIPISEVNDDLENEIIGCPLQNKKEVTNMKAAQINEYGGSEVIKINNNAPKPTVSRGKILVEVHAAGVNPVDWKIRQGYMQEMAPLEFPATLGGDFSGVVAEIGDDVSGFKKGDEVYGYASILSDGSGTFAEFASVDAKTTARKPKNLNHVEAAALPLTGASAWQVLVDHIGISRGKKILIHGGAA